MPVPRKRAAKEQQKEKRQIRNPGYVHVPPSCPESTRDIGGRIKISARSFRRDCRDIDTSVLHRASLSEYCGGIPAGSWWYLSSPLPSAPGVHLCRSFGRKFNRSVHRFRFHMKNFIGMITPWLKLARGRTRTLGRTSIVIRSQIDIHRDVSCSLISPGSERASKV